MLRSGPALYLRASILLLLGTLPCAADAPKLPAMPAQRPVPIQAYGEQNAACLEWTDGCVLCTRGTGGQPNCSTPGIACQPAGLQCKRLNR